MSTGTTLALATAVAGLMGITFSQDAPEQTPGPPSTPDLPLTLAYNSDVPTLSFADALMQSQDARVTARFSNASVGEVVEWLTNNGVSFLMTDSEIPKDMRVSLNIVNQPVKDVMSALASAMGGRWERQGDIHVFKRGNAFFAPGDFTPPTVEMPKGFKWDSKNLPKGNWKFEGGTPRPMTDAERKAFEKSMKELRENLPKMRKEIEKSMKEGKGGVYEFQMDAKAMERAMEEMRKHMPEMDKDIAKALEEARKNKKGDVYHYRLEGPEFKRAMEEARKSMTEAQKLMEKEMKDGKVRAYTFNLPPGAEGKFYRVAPGGKIDAEVLKGLRDHGAFERMHGLEGLKEVRPFRSVDFQSLVRSLTPEQRRKHERQGYLHISDLTPAQRKQLGIKGDERNFTLSFSYNNEKLTIKSDR